MADATTTRALGRLVDIMARLRAPGGCPWDREQTPQTLRPYLLEETYEVLDAIEHGSPAALRDELGDLLLQIVFHAEIAREAGQFTIADVATAIADKLERRHPHVFGDVRVGGADDVMRNWQTIKAEERRAGGGDAGVLGGVPRALPALARAQKVGDRLSHVGFDWRDVGAVLEVLDDERAELAAALAAGDTVAARREVGDLLLTLASVARHLDVSAELALGEATDRLAARVRHVEQAAAAAGRTLAALDPDERDRLWRDAKTATDAVSRKSASQV
ncbi:MAG TPA: nucleoside triphosphate pyrophosphohydrolase [Candidatus Eisenbacteria bacterium]|nr:nucleoside triphosphate pyrophosphohydrolase [Candidatus Eisenbacteria bacterium]